MTPDEVNAVLSGAARVKVKKDSRYTFFKNYLKNNAKGVLSGARAFYIRFYERRVYQIELFYNRGYRWQELKTFVGDYSNSAGIALENFEFKNGYATAECVGFTIKADYILNPHIEITDDVVKERVNK